MVILYKLKLLENVAYIFLYLTFNEVFLSAFDSSATITSKLAAKGLSSKDIVVSHLFRVGRLLKFDHLILVLKPLDSW